MLKNSKNKDEKVGSEIKFRGSRRTFLAFSGATLAATTLVLAGCDDNEEMVVPVTEELKSPTNLVADSTTPGEIKLTWTPNSTMEDGFRVDRSMTSNDGFAQVAEVGKGVTTYVDKDIEEGKEYFYQVKAFKGNEVSASTMVVSSMVGTSAVSFGEGDVAILNYAFALEQLEAAFYTAVIAGGYYSNATEEEKRILSDLQKHEVIHREFFKAALTAAAPDAIIPDLEFDFSSVDFEARASVLGTAKVFEDLGVSAYNGAGQFIQNADYLTLAGKIVSVEARHASAIRDLLNPNSADFSGDDIVNSSGLEVTRSMQDVLAAAAPFIVTKIDGSSLPQGGYQIPLP